MAQTLKMGIIRPFLHKYCCQHTHLKNANLLFYSPSKSKNSPPPHCARGIMMYKSLFLKIARTLPIIISFGIVSAQAGTTVVDDFTGTSANLPWKAFNGACLTAGNGAGPIPACKGLAYYGNEIQTGLTNNQDTPGFGALRFTNGCANGTCYYHQNGAIISTAPFPSNQGIQVTFTTYTYGGDNSGGHGADGIGFYLLNGTQAPNIGAWGGSLGYSCSNTNPPYNGMAGAYLGLGIDEYGNFLNQGDNTATGYGYVPGRIGLRGYGNINLAALQAIDTSATTSTVQAVCKNGGNYEDHTLPDYAAIPNAYKTLPSNQPIADESATNRTQARPITYKLIITSSGLLSFSYNYNNTGFTPVISQQDISSSNGPMPPSFLFGFGGSTGGSDNVHEITCFEASPSTRATSSPIAPLSLSAGSLIYELSSNPDPVAGHVQAFQTVAAPTSTASAPVGTASGTAIWDAGDPTHMPASARSGDLYSTGPTPSTGSPAGAGVVTLLTSLDSTAFALTSPTTCVPSISVIIDYTIDPNYNPTSSCNYLNGRQSGWMLGGLSQNDHAQYLGPPGNANLLSLGGYVPFAQNNNSREKLLLFTSNDGFLYAVDAMSGNLVWGWMPRPFVAQLQAYQTFQSSGNFDGGFTTTDAVDTTTNPAASNWATYVVGTAQGGAYHYALKLSSNTSSNSTSPPSPTSQTWGTAVSSGTSPQEQAPVIVTVKNTQYALYIVNTITGTGSSAVTTSTLYEQNVVTGLPASGTAISAALPFVANSLITYVSSTGSVWIGDNNGGVWSLNVSGTASSDAGSAVQVATTSPKAPINFVGYTEISGLPYIWAATQNEITAFSLSGGSAQILWASSGGASPSGYLPTGSSGGLQSSTSVMPLQVGGQISAPPALVNGVLIVPVYVPPTSSCALVGVGFYDLFDLLSGGLPKIPITYKNNTITNGIVSLGSGIPYTPSVSVTPNGTVVYPGNSQAPNPQNPISPILFGGSVMNKPIAWRQY